MAVRQPTYERQTVKSGEVVQVTWTGLTQATLDTGSPISLAEYSDKTFQTFGTFGGSGALLIEGSNDGGTTWAPLSNRQGTAMSFTAAGMNTSQDRPILVRPRVTGGDGTTSLTVAAACHRADLSGVG